MTQYQIYQNLEGFIFKAEWFKIYDFIENVITFYKKDDDCKKFIEHCNILLEEDACAYRIIGEQVVKLTSDEEIAEVEKVLETPFDPIKTHITKSLQFLSDRTTPDYHNSIKESISAVECICQIIAEDRNASLGKALKLLETKGFELNPVLFEGLQKLYGYTNTEDGVRHAMMEVDTVDQDDALFMLVICSAFVNYLKVEASKIGIDLMANYNTITGN